MQNNAEMLIRKLNSTCELTDYDRHTLSELPIRVRELNADVDLIRDGDAPQECCLLISGFMQRSKVLPNGKRQILAFNTPGDIPDLQSLGLRTMDHNIGTTVASKVGFISHASLRTVMRKSQRIADAFWREPLIEGAIFRTWITGMGQRSAHGNLAHLLCEVFTRLEAVGMATKGTCHLPLTQVELGDALGLSTVHVNRTVMELRSEGLIELHSNRLIILNWKRLAAAAQFNPSYLHLRKSAIAA